MAARKHCVIILLLFSLLLCSCAHNSGPEAPHTGQIYLYGEVHADAECLEKELALWGSHYDRGMRDLFMEMPCYTAARLNEWMRSDTDVILDRLYRDWEGTLSHSQDVLDFYRRIKRDYPETVFHGTDVGHQYDTVGARYITDMRESGQIETEAYALAQEIIEQGKTFYLMKQAEGPSAYAYRENCMAENFVREYETLSGADVMGIYGAMHTDPESMDVTGSTDSMAKQLAARYGDALHTEDLSCDDPVQID